MFKSFFNNFLFTLSTFSKVPTPIIEYNEKNTKYTFLCLPLVGVVLGGLYYLVYFLASYFIDENAIIAIILIIANIEITGGIHFDGLLDSLDAFKSYRNKEEKKRIIKDSRIGAFALIHYSAVILLYFVAYYYMSKYDLGILLVLAPILSRTFTLLLVCNNKREKNDMLDDLISEDIIKKYLFIVIFFVLLAYVIAYFSGSIVSCTVLIIGALIYTFYFNIMFKRHFDAMCGDLCGYYSVSVEYFAPIILILYTIIKMNI